MEIVKFDMETLRKIFAKGFFTSEFVLVCVVLYLMPKDGWVTAVCVTALVIVYIVSRTHVKSPYTPITHTTISK